MSVHDFLPRAGKGPARDRIPPFRLPGEHFAAALGFLLAGAVLLVWVAPDVALGLFPLPRVAAATHLFTLGWLTTSIMGALYQFLPVSLGEPIRWRRLAEATFWLHVPGVALFVAGLLGSWPVVRTAGAGLFGTALLLFALNLAATLRRAEKRNLTWWALAAAAAYLVVTVVLGVTLALNLDRGFLGQRRFLALGVHIHVAAIGWVFLVVIGVARRLLPMFLLSHAKSERWIQAAVGLVAGGVAWLVAFHHAGGLVAVLPASLLAGGGAAAFLVHAARLYYGRSKPKLDPGMRLVAAALAFQALALALAPVALWRGYADPRTAVAYVSALILGGLSLFVAGHYYKIIPFLTWFHHFGPLAGTRPLPKVLDLYHERTGDVAGTLLATGVLGLVVATLAGAPASAARGAALLFAVGAAILAAQMYAVSRRRPQ
ncbi:MAG TPA: hypothetical protein VF832_16210 [Longimicrobiales bacterium]